MRFKLDENIGTRGADRLRAAGHDVATVGEQSLERCLVTFDLDFGNPVLFDPTEYSGIVVIRLSKPASLTEIELCIGTLMRGLEQGPVEGKLWIVDRGMIREYQPPR